MGAAYIAFEGTEGCGKSTHAARLAERLGAVLTRETGGTAIGRRIREILHDTAVTNLNDHAEALLTAADRAQHLAEVVEPTLAKGQHVVSDRSVFSTLAYQGYGRGLSVDEVRQVNNWAIGGRWPDLVVFIDTSDEQLQRRMRGRQLDRFEREDPAFHQRVIDGFRAMSHADPTRWVTVSGDRSIAAVADDVWAAVHDRLELG